MSQRNLLQSRQLVEESSPAQDQKDSVSINDSNLRHETWETKINDFIQKAKAKKDDTKHILDTLKQASEINQKKAKRLKAFKKEKSGLCDMLLINAGSKEAKREIISEKKRLEQSLVPEFKAISAFQSFLKRKQTELNNESKTNSFGEKENKRRKR